MNALEELTQGVSDPKQLLNTYSDYIIRLEDFISGLDEKAEIIYRKLRTTDDAFLKRLDAQARQLVEAQKALNIVKEKFERSSDGAIRVGLKLEKADGERRRLQTAIELMNLVQIFELIPPKVYDNYTGEIDEADLRAILPEIWSDAPWGDIARTLQGLRSVLHNINSEDAKSAPKNVQKLAGIIESFLLRRFDGAIMQLIQDPGNILIRVETLNLTSWLHLFHGGSSVQEYYLRAVINKRIVALGTGLVAVATDPDVAAKAGLNTFDDDEDDTSSAGDSLPDAVLTPEEKIRREIKASLTTGEAAIRSGLDNISKLPKSLPRNIAAMPKLLSLIPASQTAKGGNVVDSLSELFGMISSISAEQFAIISLAFPCYAVSKVTRVLVQRIFNDSAFGIMIRVDSSLRPKAPLPPLSLADYLDCLLTVKEKLFALQIILQEYTSAEQYKKNVQFVPLPTSDAIDLKASLDEKDIAIDTPEAISTDVQEYIKEQVNKLLEDYLKDYFDREFNFLRLKMTEYITKATKDASFIQKSPGLAALMHPPQIRYEKFKSIDQIVESVANIKFVDSCSNLISDSLSRILVIGQSDLRLHVEVQQLYSFLLEFIEHGLLTPCCQACTTMLLQKAAARPSFSSLPPMEYLHALAAILNSLDKLKQVFLKDFISILKDVPNAIPVCRENRKRTVKLIEDGAKDSLHAWSLAVLSHVEKQLSNLQSKYDYFPKNDLNNAFSMGRNQTNIGTTLACSNVCKSLIQVFSAVTQSSVYLGRLNFTDLFWKPFGQQFMAVLIGHIKKQVISREGAQCLLRDIDEYCNVMNKAESTELLDMLSCLKEIIVVYVVAPEDVVKVVVEHLRHLDTALVLSLVKARSDYVPGGSMSVTRGTTATWTRQLEDLYSSFKSDIILPWEGRKPLTIMAFAESAKGTATLGPSSLRKVSMVAPLSLGAGLQDERTGSRRSTKGKSMSPIPSNSRKSLS